MNRCYCFSFRGNTLRYFIAVDISAFAGANDAPKISPKIINHPLGKDITPDQVTAQDLLDWWPYKDREISEIQDLFADFPIQNADQLKEVLGPLFGEHSPQDEPSTHRE